MAGIRPEGSVLIYDDDHYYMGSVIAEQLVADGGDVLILAGDTAGRDTDQFCRCLHLFTRFPGCLALTALVRHMPMANRLKSQRLRRPVKAKVGDTHVG